MSSQRFAPLDRSGWLKWSADNASNGKRQSGSDETRLRSPGLSEGETPLLIAVSRQPILQLFRQLLPASGGILHRLPGHLRAEIVGFRSDLFRHQSPPASLCHCSTRFRHTEAIARSAIHLLLHIPKRGGRFTLPTVKAALKGFRLMIFLEIDRDDDDFAVLLETADRAKLSSHSFFERNLLRAV